MTPNHSVYSTTLADGEQVTTLVPHGIASPDAGAELTELFGADWFSVDAGRVHLDDVVTREIVTVGWDGATQPMRRFRDELDLPEHQRQVVDGRTVSR